MGNYTELMIALDLAKDTPKAVTDILAYMADVTEHYKESDLQLPDNELFHTDRWQSLFTCDSHYFDGTTVSRFYYDDIGDTWKLTSRANLKNYDSEIDKFLRWICQYVDYRWLQFVGYTRFEQDENPTLIYMEKNLVCYAVVRFDPEQFKELDAVYLAP